MSTGEKLRTQPLPMPAVAVGPGSGLLPVGTASSPSPPAAEVDLPKKCSRCNHRYPTDFLLCPRDGTPLELEGQAGDPFLGRVLGETYQILRLVGEGGMGRVYEAQHLRLPDRRLAVKILQPEFARDTDICTRFQREAEVASSVAHPNVIEVYDVSKTPDGVPYIVCEFLAGEELGVRLEREHADVGYCVHVTRQVCRALSAAHAKGVVHRDMKPENVFLVERDGESVVKVIDFGISKAHNPGDANLTRTGMVMGTPSYMAPEQARGDKAVDIRADIYAVGALLYHALTGKKPFDSDDPTSTLTLVLTEEPERPRSINVHIPEGLELVVQRAMAKDPRDRYPSMGELDAALAPFDTVPVHAPTSGSHTLVRREGGGVAVSSAALPSDPNARTMMVGQGPAAVSTSHTAARYARPTIVLAAIGLVLWLAGGLVDAITGLIRWFHDGERLANVELVLVLVGTIAAAITPLALFVARVSKVWQNSVKTLELATDLRRTVVVGLATYGTAALTLHIVMNVGLRDSARLTNGLFDVGLFGASILFAAVAGGVGPIARSIRRGK